ncbi:protein pxr1-like [Pitangus sulphuratus]|nr:protein pxr1-like [Pitangus sulphuratus]
MIRAFAVREERNSSADIKVSEEGLGGVDPDPGAKIPLQSVLKTTAKQDVLLQPMGIHGKAKIHLQPMGDHTLEEVNVPKGGCDPVGSLCCTRLLAGPVDLLGGPMLKQGCYQDL